MLDSKEIESRGGLCMRRANSNQTGEGGFIADPMRPEYVNIPYKKNTVKELLMKRRQNWSCSRDENNLEPKCKSAKVAVFAPDASPQVSGPAAPETSAVVNLAPVVYPGNGPIVPQLTRPHPALQGQVAPAAAAKVTLFHWQIHKETRRVDRLSPEQLSTQDADGDTFLHIAVAQGKRALAYVLATKMAACGSVDMKEHNGQTALQIAAATNHHLVVQDLLTHGAQINSRDLWGRSPLHVCAEKGHLLSLQSIWKTLKGSGQMIDIEMFNYDGLTPLHAAVLSHNAAVKELSNLGNPCSYMTAQLEKKKQTYVQCVQTLLLMGASLGTKDLKSGRTCLHMAAEEANVEMLNVFLEQPSSLSIVNLKMFSGNTALHIVSSLENRASQAEAVKLLMRKGADPGARNFESELPSQLVPAGPDGNKVRQILKGKYCYA